VERKDRPVLIRSVFDFESRVGWDPGGRGRFEGGMIERGRFGRRVTGGEVWAATVDDRRDRGRYREL
jgi:hypothetical protein